MEVLMAIAIRRSKFRRVELQMCKQQNIINLNRISSCNHSTSTYVPVGIIDITTINLYQLSNLPTQEFYQTILSILFNISGDGTLCDPETCVGISSGTATTLNISRNEGNNGDCHCQCHRHLPVFREDLRICVDDIHGEFCSILT